MCKSGSDVVKCTGGCDFFTGTSDDLGAHDVASNRLALLELYRERTTSTTTSSASLAAESNPFEKLDQGMEDAGNL